MNSYKEDLELARKIAEKVNEIGGKTYFVGGCVRDFLMKKEPNDIDIEVFGVEEDKLKNILSKIGELKEITSSFDIYNLRGSNLDITLPRSSNEYEADPFISEKEAAGRRDFTINSVMQNAFTDETLDYYGGIDDINSKTIRTVSNDSFTDDPLRVFRMADFIARFNFVIEDSTKLLAEEVDLSEIKKERVFEELRKALLKSDKPSIFFQTLREINQLSYWFPELEALIATEQNPQWHLEGNVWNHTMLVLDEAAKLREIAEEPFAFMLSALFHDLGKAITTTIKDGKIISHEHDVKGVSLTKDAIRRLTTNKKIIAYAASMTELHMKPNMLVAQKSSQKAFNRMFYKSVCPHDLLLLAKADHLGRGKFSDYTETERKLKDALENYNTIMSKPHVTGEDLIKAGVKPSEQFSELLEFADKLRLSDTPYNSALKQVLSLARKSQVTSNDISN